MKLTEKQLRDVVLSEVKKMVEGAPTASNPSDIKHVVVVAEKLLKAVNSFLDSATDEMKASMVSLEDCKKSLENMLSAPSSYTPKQIPVVQRVSLKHVK
jgi:hypothetical protein